METTGYIPSEEESRLGETVLTVYYLAIYLKKQWVLKLCDGKGILASLVEKSERREKSWMSFWKVRPLAFEGDGDFLHFMLLN